MTVTRTPPWSTPVLRTGDSNEYFTPPVPRTGPDCTEDGPGAQRHTKARPETPLFGPGGDVLLRVVPQDTGTWVFAGVSHYIEDPSHVSMTVHVRKVG